MTFFSKLLRHKPPADVEEEVDEIEQPCPICVQLRQWAQIRSATRPWNEQQDPLPPVRRQTHHVAGVDYNMCFEHYNAVSAYLLLEWTEPARR